MGKKLPVLFAMGSVVDEVARCPRLQDLRPRGSVAADGTASAASPPVATLARESRYGEVDSVDKRALFRWKRDVRRDV